MDHPTAEQLAEPVTVARPIPWRGGPPLDPASEDAYRAEQADYQ